jgi:ACS family hexuronate transporter-like MFS transporter
VRWRIALLLSVAIAISYLDRQALSIAVAAIQREIPLTNTDFSRLQIAFLAAYGLMYAGGGALIDRVGTRRGFALIMIWWSLACAAHGFARGFGTLAASRFLLGAGEGGGFPAATKAVAEWFPARERSTAMGIINAGTAIGAVVAPPLIAAVILSANWRWAFVVCGLAGLLWTCWWVLDYQPPARHPRLTAAERTTIAEVLDTTADAGGPALPWTGLLALRPVWTLVVAKFLTDGAWYFYLFWLPKYLYDARGFDVKQVGAYAWIPYAAAGIGSVLGGSFSSWLLARGRTINASRKIALGASAAVMPLIVFVTQVRVEWAIVLFSIAFFGQQSWSTLVMIVPTDMFPRRVVASVAGLVGFGGAMGGIVSNLMAGRMLDLGMGYGMVFAIMGMCHVMAFVLILIAIPEISVVRLSGRPVDRATA